MRVHFRKTLFGTTVLSLILITIFLAIAFLWKWLDIPKTPDPEIWKGFPKEEIWRKFFSLSIPLVYGLYTLAYTILSKLISSPKREAFSELYRFRRYDFLTYGLIPIFLLMMVLWRHLGDWYLWFGGFYLSVVFIKTAILVKVIYRWIGFDPPSIPPLQRGDAGGSKEGKACPRSYQSGGERAYIRWGLFLTSFLLYASVSLWINYSISTTGDEQLYLMITHSLFSDRDFNLKNNIEQGDNKNFSWIYFPMHSLVEKDGGLYSTAYTILCLLLIPGYALGSLLPDYALGGRLGSLLTLNLITAWLLLEIFLFTAEISKSHRAAFISWAIAGFTSPVFFFSAQVYPEIAGALVLVFTLRRLLNPDLRKGFLAIISAIVLILLKKRFVLIVLTLPLLWAFTSSHKSLLIRIFWTGIATLGSALTFIFVDKTFLGGVVMYNYLGSVLGSVGGILRALAPELANIPTLSGLIFDQEFGLLFYSPLYAFGIIGIPYLLSRYRRETLVIISPVIVYIFVIINFAVYYWYAGWSLPSRYIVIITPLIGLMAGIILSERRGLITAILTRSLWIWSISIVFIMTLITPWRYNSANGANILLRQIEDVFSTKITRFFPSFISPTPEGLIVFSGILVFFIVASILILRQKPLSISPDPASSPVIASSDLSGGGNLNNSPESSHTTLQERDNPPSSPFIKGGIEGDFKEGMGGLRSFPRLINSRTSAWGLLLLLITGGIIIILGRGLPTRQLEGENMRHTSGIQYKDSRINVWILREKGSLWDYVVFPENRAVSINIQGAGLCNTGEAPHMVVSVGDKVIGEVDILYGKDSWLRSNYTFKVPSMKRGMYSFSIELTNGVYDHRSGTFCGLYVDRVELRKEPQ